jgi:thiol-disulfide isomerase/thioredoxin
MSKKITAIKFIIFCCFFFNIVSSISQTNENVPFNNIAQHTSPKPISPIVFEDFSGNKVNLGDYSGKLVIVNFWATWCKPCKEEMPSLDILSQNENFENLIIFPVNIENVNYEKTKKFFSNLNVKKLGIFFDPNLNFVKELNLRGVPTTVIINKKREEFARIIGSIDFKDKKFLKWLSNYD